jgi:hypothetical protein
MHPSPTGYPKRHTFGGGKRGKNRYPARARQTWRELGQDVLLLAVLAVGAIPTLVTHLCDSLILAFHVPAVSTGAMVPPTNTAVAVSIRTH